MSISSQSVVAFLTEFEALAEKEDFSLVENMIDENAFFRFNDGDFVGRRAIRAAFEKTWRGDPTIKKLAFTSRTSLSSPLITAALPRPTRTTGKVRSATSSSQFVVVAPASCSRDQLAFVSSTST